VYRAYVCGTWLAIEEGQISENVAVAEDRDTLRPGRRGYHDLERAGSDDVNATIDIATADRNFARGIAARLRVMQHCGDVLFVETRQEPAAELFRVRSSRRTHAMAPAMR